MEVSDSTSLDNRMQNFSADESGNFLLLWSGFDGELEHLYARKLETLGEGWQNTEQLDIGEQYDLIVDEVLYNHEQLPTIFAQDDMINSTSSRLWTIDFR